MKSALYRNFDRRTWAYYVAALNLRLMKSGLQEFGPLNEFQIRLLEKRIKWCAAAAAKAPKS